MSAPNFPNRIHKFIVAVTALVFAAATFVNAIAAVLEALQRS